MVSLPCGRTRAIQKLLESLTSGLQISIVMKALSAGVIALTKSTNGHHVIQFCLKNFSEKDNEVIIFSPVGQLQFLLFLLHYFSPAIGINDMLICSCFSLST